MATTGQTLTSEPVAAARCPLGALFGRVLERFCDDQGMVDFGGLARERRDLDAAIAHVARVAPQTHPDAFDGSAARIAYHLNAYNALAMHGVLEQGRPRDFASFFKRARFFFLQRFIVGGERRSLHSYENRVIRDEGEPRVHFALNCMTRGCPTLRREPYAAARLERQLERDAHAFFADPRHCRLDPVRRICHLSEILRFYADDFAPDMPGLIRYVNRYRPEPVPESYDVAFIPYDWTVIDRRR